MGHLSILQKKGQVGQRGRQKRGDQPTIHLIVNFFGKKSSKYYREESTSFFWKEIFERLPRRIHKLTQLHVFSGSGCNNQGSGSRFENNEDNCELKPFPPDNLSLFSFSQAQRQPCHGNTDEG